MSGDEEKDGRWLPEGVEGAAEEVDLLEGGPDEEEEEDDEDLEESYGADIEAPWSPVPLAKARAFLKANPMAKLDLIFPEAYAEDRSAKLKDLATAQGLDYFSHQRVATQAAQEFGFEQFDYDGEMEAIRQEKKKYADILGAGDLLAKRIAGPAGGMGGPGGITIGAPSPGLAAEDEEDHLMPRRADLAGPERVAFRRDQREAFAGLARSMRSINRAMQLTARRLEEQGQPAVRLTSAEVLYMNDGGPKRCDRCALWLRASNRCSIHAAEVVVRPDMVCGLYVNGDPMDEGEPQGFVTPQESDLGAGNTSCGNCRFGSGQPTCQHPCLDGFAIDNTGGCCNAWTAPGAVEASRPGAASEQARRIEEAVAKLRDRAAPVVNVTVPERQVEVHVAPAPAPEVNVTVEGQKPRSLKIEHDERGRATRISEEQPGGADRPH